MCTAQDVDMHSRSTSAYAWGRRMHRCPVLAHALVRGKSSPGNGPVHYSTTRQYEYCVCSKHYGRQLTYAQICASMNNVLLVTAYVQVQYRAQGARRQTPCLGAVQIRVAAYLYSCSTSTSTYHTKPHGHHRYDFGVVSSHLFRDGTPEHLAKKTRLHQYARMYMYVLYSDIWTPILQVPYLARHTALGHAHQLYAPRTQTRHATRNTRRDTETPTHNKHSLEPA